MTDYKEIAQSLRNILSVALTEMDKDNWDCGDDNQCHILHDIEDALIKYGPILDNEQA